MSFVLQCQTHRQRLGEVIEVPGQVETDLLPSCSLRRLLRLIMLIRVLVHDLSRKFTQELSLSVALVPGRQPSLLTHLCVTHFNASRIAWVPGFLSSAAFCFLASSLSTTSLSRASVIFLSRTILSALRFSDALIRSSVAEWAALLSWASASWESAWRPGASESVHHVPEPFAGLRAPPLAVDVCPRPAWLSPLWPSGCVLARPLQQLLVSLILPYI
jgi:hypothetical protein